MRQIEGHILSQEYVYVCAHHAHFVERYKDRSVEQGCPVGKEKKEEWSFVLQDIISVEGFDRTRELSVNHVSKLNIHVR